MLLYVLRRLLQTVPLLLVISALIFTLLYLMPGDPLYRMLEGIPNLRPEDYDRLRKLYGFDDPIYVQYGKWLWQLLQLNPGYSREYGQPVFNIILPALKNTLVLTIAAVVLGKLIAIALGIFSAVRQYSIGDYLLTATTFVAYSVPAFWLGLMLIILFSVKLGWLPTSGIVNSELEPGSWAATVDWLKHLILPVAVLAISEIIQVQRFMRSSLARSAAPGLSHHGARQGFERNCRHWPPCAQKRIDSGSDDHRRHHAASRRRLDCDRNGFRLSGHGPAALHVDHGQ